MGVREREGGGEREREGERERRERESETGEIVRDRERWREMVRDGQRAGE